MKEKFMKRFSSVCFGFVLAVATLLCTSCEDNDTWYSISYSNLPHRAQWTLDVYFDYGAIYYTSCRDDYSEYEVEYGNGVSVYFNYAGDWTKVHAYSTGVPMAMIPVRIRSYLSAYYAGYIVRKLEFDGYTYSVLVSTGDWLKFDSAGNRL